MATFTTLASFSGPDGASPGYGSLLVDANGNLFGTTVAGGDTGDGTVFELVNTGSGYSLQTLVSFDGANGGTPFAGLTADAQGNLFGVTQAGGAAGSGTAFELVNTGSGYSLQTLASFSGSNGASPMGGLVADANGNLFGATQSGGDNGQGTVFELVHIGSGYSLQTLASFDFTNGAEPTGPLITDANGDLFGTTLQGGPGNQGTVFELVHTGSGYSLQTLATFDGSNGSFLYGGLTADAQGDLFGTTYSGGANNAGTVFELVKTDSGYTFQTLASLDYNATGGFVFGGLVADAQGDLFGTALAGGGVGFGTVFELVHTGAGYSLQTLYSFGGADGGLPEGTLTLDAYGNLFGATAGGGTVGSGTVFEISAAVADDGAAAEQAALHLTVNSGSPAPIGAAGAAHVAFSVAGMRVGDGGDVTFTDQANHAVVVHVSAGQTSYVADLSSLTEGGVTASLQVATNSVGDSFTPIAGNQVILDFTPPAQPSAPADAAVIDGAVNTAHDTAGQTIGGTAEAGAAVTVYDHGSQVTTVIADGAGAWGYEVGVLGDGSAHSYTVTATDAAGNVSAASEALSFTVDTSAPAQPTAPADASVISGYVNAAHNTAGQTIGGTAEAGASVSIFDNGAQVTTTIADGAGAWSYQVGALADGSSHSYTVSATDAAGNTSAAGGALSFVVDTSAPPAPAGLADASISGGYVNAAHDTAGQTLTGTAEDGALVRVYDNGVKLGTATADISTGAWNFVFGVLDEGAHEVTATATDAAGNLGAISDALTFTVDTIAPVAAVQTVLVGAGGSALVGGSAEAGATVTLFDGAAQVGVATAGLDGAWSYPVGVLADGSSHSYAVTATDAAGNASALSDAFGFTAGGAPAPPPQPAAPGDASVINGYVNAAHDTAAQSIGGTAEAGALVTLYDHGTQVTTVVADGAGAWSWQVGVLADGAYNYTVTATNAGGVSSLSDALNFTVDTTPPDPPAPVDASVINGYVNAAHDTAGQTIGGTVEAGASVAVYDQGTLLATVAADSFGSWSFPVGALADGSTHSYAVTATDAAGNTGGLSDALNFTVDTTPPPAPTGLADASIVGGYVNKAHDTAGQSVTGTAEHGALVTVYDNGVKLGTATADAATGAWTFQLGGLGDGLQSLIATATDAAGNTGAASAALTFKVDATPPVPVVDDVVDGSKGQSIVSGSSEAGSKVTVFDGGQQVGVVTAAADGIWSVSLKLNGSTVHQFTETAVDLAGNSGASAGTGYYANPANKQLAGGAGDDVLIGRSGIGLTGGGGHDHFMFNAGFGNETVTDFTSGSDQIWFSHALFGSAASVMAHAHQSGADTVIAYDSGDTVTLTGVLASALHAGDFGFF